MRMSPLQQSKHVIMVAHDFPPEGNAGAYRPLRFARHLFNHGWTPTVISALPSQYERYDPALLQSVPEEVEVIRLQYSDWWQVLQAWRSRRNVVTERRGDEKLSSPTRSSRGGIRSRFRSLVRTMEACWYHPDPAAPWQEAAVRATIEACGRKGASVIWSTAGPVTAFYVASLASRKTKIPFVLDFRDAWTITYNEFEARRPLWALRRDRRKMFQLLKDAQAVVFRYASEAECFWQAYAGALGASRIHIIPNGFEAPIENARQPPGDKCTILYAGTLADYRYDTLLDALNMLKDASPSQAKKLRLLFIGEGVEAIAHKAKKLNLDDVIETSGRKSHAEISSMERHADALLILGRPAMMKGHELFAGAKLFGYMKTGRPIVGILPEDETRNILHGLGVSTVADVNSTREITTILCSVLDHWSGGTLASLVPNPKACEAYSSEQQTAALVRALEGIPPEKPFIPGAQLVPPSLRDEIDGFKRFELASRL